MEMQDTFGMTPTLIQRWIAADHPAVVDIPAEDGGRALLVFTDPERAETFRTETGRFPDSEGFEVEAVDLDGFRTIIDVWGFERVGLWGLDPEILSELDAEVFIAILEDAEAREEA